MSNYELAQLNIGIIKGPMDSPVMADFANNLERINALAERSAGFVWRLKTEEGDATAIRPFENENMLVNMSVWRDVESLNAYVYSSDHVNIMRRRREWFERMSEIFLVLWWVRMGHRPSVDQAIAKLDLLRARPRKRSRSAMPFRLLMRRIRSRRSASAMNALPNVKRMPAGKCDPVMA